MRATKNVHAQILEAKQCVETKLYSPNLCLGKTIVVLVWFVCQVLHVVVRNPPLISLDTVTVMEDDRKLYEIIKLSETKEILTIYCKHNFNSTYSI